MSEHQTEEQQVEAIKAFWQENGNAVITGLVVGLGGFVGFNYYQDSKLAEETAVTDAYQTVVQDAAKDKAKLLTEGEAFTEKYSDTSLASLADFSIAKEAIAKKDYPLAEKTLTKVITGNGDAGLKAIATVRLARVQTQQAQYDDALKTLDAKLPESFKSMVAEAKGDVYLKQDKLDLARTAYQTAIDAGGLTASPSLQMKLDDLAQLVNLPK